MPDPTPAAPAERVVFESDWLASRPYFYDLRRGKHGHDINAVIDLAGVEIDAEGFNDYLDFGYAVFERTPVRGVHVLRHSSRLMEGPDGLRVDYLPDSAEAWYERRSTVEEVLELASVAVNECAADADADVVVPTSGGLDSRFINMLLDDRSRIRAFTYGQTDDPARSHDAVLAAELARRLGIRWELVTVGDFHKYLDRWNSEFGVSTHAHGMYQMEFYDQVAGRVEPGTLVLSGAFGDMFSGDDGPVRRIATLERPEDLLTVLRYMPMCADSAMSLFASRHEGAEKLFEEEPRLRAEVRPRLVAEARQWMTTMSYLYRLPPLFGLRCRAPFLEGDLALRMLTLPDALRRDRSWQREIFAGRGLDIETAHCGSDYRNTLNFRAMRKAPLAPLDVGVLREVVRPDYVRWINRHAGRWGVPGEALWRLGWKPGYRRMIRGLQRIGISEQRTPAYFAYLTLKPIESLLKRRDRVRTGALDR